MSCAQAADDIVWLCSGPRLLAIDVSDPSHPVVRGRSEVMPGVISSLYVEVDRRVAWVSAAGQVIAVDLQDARFPRILSHIDMEIDPSRSAGGARITGSSGRLWVMADWKRPVRGFDVSDPRSPREMTVGLLSSDEPEAVEAVTATRDRLYAVGRFPRVRSTIDGTLIEGLAVVSFQVSATGDLVLAAASAVPEGLERGVKNLSWDSELLRLVVKGSGVRVASFRESMDRLLLARLDTVDPGGFAAAALVNQGRLYGTWNWNDAGNLGSYVFDLRRPNATHQLSVLPASPQDTGLYSPAIAVANGHVWVTDSGGSVRGLDLSLPGLGESGRLNLVGEATALDLDRRHHRWVVVSGRAAAYIDSGSWIRSDPLALGVGATTDVELDDDHLLVVTSTFASTTQPNGFRLWSLSNPEHPRVVLESAGMAAPLGTCRPAAMMDNGRLLVSELAGGWTSVASWRLDGVESPREDRHWSATPCGTMALDGDHLGRVFIDARDPQSMSWQFGSLDLANGRRAELRLGSVLGSRSSVGLVMLKEAAWIAMMVQADGRWGLELRAIDLAKPEQPALRDVWYASLVVSGGAAAVAAVRVNAPGNRLFVAVREVYPGDRGGRLLVFDVEDREVSRLLISIPISSMVSNMSVSPEGDSVAVAGGRFGMEIIHRPTRGWEAAAGAPLIEVPSPTLASPPSATKMFRSRVWLPVLGRP